MLTFFVDVVVTGGRCGSGVDGAVGGGGGGGAAAAVAASARGGSGASVSDNGNYRAARRWCRSISSNSNSKSTIVVLEQYSFAC